MLSPLRQELSCGVEGVLHGGPTSVSPSTALVALLHLHQLLFARLVTHLEVLQPTDKVRQEG